MLNLLLTIHLSAQTLEWAKQISNYGKVEKLAASPDGSIFILFYSTEIIKCDTNGNILWTKSEVSGNGIRIGKSIATCPDGGFVVVGYFGSEGVRESKS